MGTERWYIALPGDCDLLKRAQKDPRLESFWVGLLPLKKVDTMTGLAVRLSTNSVRP